MPNLNNISRSMHIKRKTSKIFESSSKIMSFGLILSLALLMVVRAQMHHPMPPPMPMQPPPPYNMYGPISPYATGGAGSMGYPPIPQQMPPPPMAPSPGVSYPPGTTMSYSSQAYPMMSAAAPYPTYGLPPPMMYPPPYQTYSGSGPMGDPFTTTSGVCKYTGSQYESPIAPIFNGFYHRTNMGMVCSRHS